MSQSGVLNVTAAYPSIPTQFDADSGSAIPIANVLNIFGTSVASGTTPVETTASGGTVTVEIQTSQAIAGTDASKIGLAAFDSAAFAVDANGFVTFAGGGAATHIGVDVNTAPGTDPVVPSGGTITFTGAQVATGIVGANVIRTDSVAANTVTIEIQRSTAVAGTDSTKNGVTHFDSSAFSVDANGFVTLGTVAVAGGGTGSTSFTAGSVVFSNGSILTQDNANFFYDDTNNRLGLGTVTPGDTLHVVGAMELDHTALENDDHAIEIVCNANGFSDVKAIDIDYITGALAAGQDEEAILVNIDQSLSTGGIVAGYLCLTTSTGSAVVNGYETGININPIVHESGSFGNATNILNVAVDVTAALASGGSGAISAFLLDNSTMTIGDAAQFGEMEIILTTPASGAGIDPLFEYSTGAATFASFIPADGTNGLRNTGAILWDASTLAGWVVAGSGRYEIRIKRQRNSLSTTPVLDELQIASLTEYKWDKDGNVNLNSLTLTTPLVVSSGGSGRASHTAYAVICGGTTATAAQQSIASVGTAGQVLTSNGAAALPTFQTNANGDVTGPGSSTDNALVRFDGATGKIIQNGVITEDDTGNLSISAAVAGANLSCTVSNTSNTASAQAFYQAQVAGGTAADAYYVANISGGQGYSWGVDNSDSDAYVLSATVTPGTTNVMRVATTGEINYPLQSAFLVVGTVSESNVTGDATTYTLAGWNSEIFDQNGDFASNTFTAPVTGRYSLTFNMLISGVLTTHTSMFTNIDTSNRDYLASNIDPGNVFNPSTQYSFGYTVLADMDAADTAVIKLTVESSTKVIDIIYNGTADPRTWFCGNLVC